MACARRKSAAQEVSMADVWRQKLGTGERWTEEDGRAALAAWEASGEPLAAFARRSGIHAQRLCWWRDRIGERASLVPVTVSGGLLGGAVVTIGAVRIEVGGVEQIPAAWLASVVTALAEVAPCS